MPRDKDLKRLVRTRMKKTGEAYTAARAQILKKGTRTPAKSPTPSARLTPAAGPSRAAFRWDRLVALLHLTFP